MGFNLTTVLLVVVLSWGLCFQAQCGAKPVIVKLLKAPKAFSRLHSATFRFEASVDVNGGNCSDCSFSCKLDDKLPSGCGSRKAFYRGLTDGRHEFKVCAKGSAGVGCAGYNWTIDTIAPTAFVSTSATFTNALNVTTDILFSEPCPGFSCSSTNSCNLLVYGAGEVMPHTLKVVQPDLRYSLLVALSDSVQVGRVIVVMDKNFCADRAGNIFNRSASSSSIVRFDRKNVYANLRTHIPEKLMQLNSATRTVLATNKATDLNVYLYFSEPILNSPAEVLDALKISHGSVVPVEGETRGNRKFSFVVENITSVAVVTVSLNTALITTRQGTSVSPIAPVTFLYDSQRPSVRLSTTCTKRTRQHVIPILVKFMKPVFGFNSSHVSISGGQLQSFREISWNSYSAEIRAEHDIVSVSIPENVTGDVAGNRNVPSNILQIRHYSMPLISTVVTIFVTAASLMTSLSAALLTVSTANLVSLGVFSRPSSSLTADPARNLFRTLCHVQVFALSRWLAVTLPVEYYEVARGIQWSIPYMNLPWEYGSTQSIMVGSNSPESSSNSYISKLHDIGLSNIIHQADVSLNTAAAVYGLPLTPMEYTSFFESQNSKPQAEYISPQMFAGWRDFYKSMFWLAVIGGSLMFFHALVLSILKLRKPPPGKQKTCGAMIFPRFEIFLLFLALPCICKASALLIRGGEVPQVVVGILFLGLVLFLLVALMMFLSVGITFGKLLQYKEVHQEGQRFLWFHYIVQKTLGPGKRGQWTWRNQPNSPRLVMFGPLFEALRGPPKYMLTQISGGVNTPKGGERIIASDDETEDAEAPCIQKLFGILRIYYTLLECVKRVALGIVAGAYATRWSYRTPLVALLSITSFQLFFLVLKKPFIKKKVQLAEIISVSCEVGLFATCFVLMQMDVPQKQMSKIGLFMVTLLLVGFLAQMLNEWYALYRQIKRLDPLTRSLGSGIKSALIGLILLPLPRPRTTFSNLEDRFKAPHADGVGREGTSSDRFRSTESRSPSTGERPWMRQLREMAKASFSRDSSSGLGNDPSTSNARRGWSGLWGSRQRSGSSSVKTSMDYGSKPKKLYRDMEAIFSSN
uniref:Bacterial Ig-like domain-containing protein n=1 Tax=Kalanchoe fedtschenkoi TaxID=63787 RepID=A0A7N0SVN3_KALFE